MAKEIRIWQVEGDHLTEATVGHLDLESRLETWLLNDISVLDAGLLVIGHQVPTSFGGFIDLLCIDRVGDLVIVELKRDKTPREVTAQVLDYASWVADLSNEEIRQLAAEARLFDDLEKVFAARFRTQLPDVLNADHRMLVVGSNIDASTERIIGYLSERYGVNINAATFQYFTATDGRELMARVFLLDPDRVERGGSKRSRNLTPEELDEQAVKIGDRVRDLYRHAVTVFGKVPILHSYTTRSSMGFAVTTDDGRKSILSFVPGESTGEDGLKYQVYTERLADLGSTSTDAVNSFLPQDRHPWQFVKNVPDFSGVHGYVTSDEEIDRLASAFGTGAIGP